LGDVVLVLFALVGLVAEPWLFKVIHSAHIVVEGLLEALLVFWA
jgi:hypothetical protein